MRHLLTITLFCSFIFGCKNEDVDVVELTNVLILDTCKTYPNGSRIYDLDLDNDSQNDISFYFSHDAAASGGLLEHYILITKLNNQVSIASKRDTAIFCSDSVSDNFGSYLSIFPCDTGDNIYYFSYAEAFENTNSFELVNSWNNSDSIILYNAFFSVTIENEEKEISYQHGNIKDIKDGYLLFQLGDHQYQCRYQYDFLWNFCFIELNKI